MAGSTGYVDDDAGAISEINVTPLVDVILVLLIVFMITMPSIVARESLRERQLDISLPETSGALPMTVQPKEVIINITSSGDYVVENKTMNPEDLAGYLSQVTTTNKGRVSVLIRGDRSSQWNSVAWVIGACSAAGIVDFRTAVSE